VSAAIGVKRPQITRGHSRPAGGHLPPVQSWHTPTAAERQARWRVPFIDDTCRHGGGELRSTAKPIHPRSPFVRLLPYPSHGLLTSQLTAPRARPLDQIHGKVGVAQLGDEVGRDGFPGAGPRVPDHIVVLTVFHTGDVAFVGHHCASGVWGSSGRAIRIFWAGAAPGAGARRGLICHRTCHFSISVE
jgi:hypothetical protein